MTLPVYATTSQLIAQAPAGVLQSFSPDALLAALTTSSRTMDDSLAKGGYVLPLTAWPESLANNCCFITTYNLLYAKGGAATMHGLVYRQRYDDAMAWLRKIENGFEPNGIVDSEPDPTFEEHGAVIVTRPCRGW